MGQFIYSFLPFNEDPSTSFTSDYGVHYFFGWLRVAYDQRIVPLVQQCAILLLFAFQVKHNVLIPETSDKNSAGGPKYKIHKSDIELPAKLKRVTTESQTIATTAVPTTPSQSAIATRERGRSHSHVTGLPPTDEKSTLPHTDVAKPATATDATAAPEMKGDTKGSGTVAVTAKPAATFSSLSINPLARTKVTNYPASPTSIMRTAAPGDGMMNLFYLYLSFRSARFWLFVINCRVRWFLVL
jgi:hypothetical protein